MKKKELKKALKIISNDFETQKAENELLKKELQNARNYFKDLQDMVYYNGTNSERGVIYTNGANDRIVNFASLVCTHSINSIDKILTKKGANAPTFAPQI